MFARIAVPYLLALVYAAVQQTEGYTAPNIIFMIADGKRHTLAPPARRGKTLVTALRLGHAHGVAWTRDQARMVE